MGRRGACLGLAAVLATAVVSLAQAGPRAVVELFTSQGCSSCPPADNLLGELAQDPTIVALSLSIDYWDYLGWKDTLALHGHSNRERAYASVRGDRSVYTPQAVINGLAHVLGSDREAIANAIAATHKNEEVLSLPVTLSAADGRLTIAVAPGSYPTKSGEVWLCPITKMIAVPVERGENKGRTLTYHNVVRRWMRLADWTGGAQTWDVPLSEFANGDIDAVAVVVQAGTAAAPGPMLGAAMTSLR
jgi:hypothetical protein